MIDTTTMDTKSNTDNTSLYTEEKPAPTLVRSMQKIMQLPLERGMEWQVFAYCINKDIIGKDNTIDDLRAVIFPLGCFPTQDLACTHAKKIMEQTGHPHIQVVQYGYPAKITTKPDVDVVQDVAVDMKGKIMKMEDETYEEQKRVFEDRQVFEKELMEECDAELDKNHIEHFKMNAYRALKHYTEYLNLQKQGEKLFQQYEMRKRVVMEHYKDHPEHEKEFLPMLKNKLVGRGEGQLYEWVEAAYNKYRNTLLDI